jgi:hypothetical protein
LPGLPPDALLELTRIHEKSGDWVEADRADIVIQCLALGKPFHFVARHLGINQHRVSAVVTLYLEGGVDAIRNPK